MKQNLKGRIELKVREEIDKRVPDSVKKRAMQLLYDPDYDPDPE